MRTKILGLLCLAALAGAADAPSATPPRLFDAGGRLSFAIPENWSVNQDFETKPLFSWTTPEGGLAQIYYETSEAVQKSHLQTELSTGTLQNYARDDVARRHPQARVLAAEARALAGRNAFEVSWVEVNSGASLQEQSVYTFVDDKFIVISLQADKNVFAWQVPDFQTWLGSIQCLVRHDSGLLASPAHGGVWIQKAAGAQVTFPGHWLIGVADDRMIGAVLTQDDKHSEITVTAEVTPGPTPLEVDAKTKKDAHDGLAEKDFKITSETEEPFHGYPAFRVAFEGYRKSRFVKGIDLWIVSPKARWLISLEGDGPLFNHLGDDYQRILNEFEFF